MRPLSVPAPGRRLLAAAIVVVLSIMSPPKVRAQEETAATRAIHGKLVVKNDQGTMFNSGAGGSARYRAHLAVASRILSILESDSGIAHPIGYDMDVWRIAGPNDAPESRFFPSFSGTYGVLMYYYYDAREVATHGIKLSTEGPGFEVLVNNPACALPREMESDADGPMGPAPRRAADYRGYPSVGDGTCIVVTSIARPLTIPVSRERWIRAVLRHRRASLDSTRSSRAAAAPDARESAIAANYKQWLADASQRAQQRKELIEALKRTNPSGAAQLERQYKSADSIQEAAFKRAMADAESPGVRAMQTQVDAAGAAAEQRIHALETLLARMSPAERRAPAYIIPGSPSPAYLVDSTAAGAAMVVAPNPAFLDKALPESAPQVITVQPDCRKIDGRAVGRACGAEPTSDYERILSQLDWNALRALTE